MCSCSLYTFCIILEAEAVFTGSSDSIFNFSGVHMKDGRIVYDLMTVSFPWVSDGLSLFLGEKRTFMEPKRRTGI